MTKSCFFPKTNFFFFLNRWVVFSPGFFSTLQKKYITLSKKYYIHKKTLHDKSKLAHSENAQKIRCSANHSHFNQRQSLRKQDITATLLSLCQVTETFNS